MNSTQSGWSARCIYWNEQSIPTSKRRLRQREAQPLMLAGHGISIRLEKGTLLVRDGNTHYPQEAQSWRFFKGGLDTPQTIVLVDGSGEITLDAIDWMAAQGVIAVRLNWDGKLISVLSTGRQAFDSERVNWQVETRADPVTRTAFALDLIRQKASATVETMHSHVPRSPQWNSAMYGIERRMKILQTIQARDVAELLGWEGGIAADYFRAWSAIPIRWKRTKQYPIPKSWHAYKSRSALRLRQHSNNRATHPVNAMLNYAYGMLVSQTVIQIVKEGYDPRLGIMHINEKNQEEAYRGFALDRMEPMRPVVDRPILELIQSETFCGQDFVVQDDGTCRLNPELARRVAELTHEVTKGAYQFV